MIDIIETECFKLSWQRFVLILLQQYGQNWIVAMTVIIFTAIFLGIFLDYRILLFAVILICLVLPGLLMLLYYNYGLTGKNYINVVNHRLIIKEDSINVLTYIPLNEDPDNSQTIDSESEEEEQENQLRDYSFQFQTLGRLIVGSAYVIYLFTDTSDGFLYLSVAAFKSKEEFNKAISRISKLEN